MYESFFELSQRPFAVAALTSRYFAGSTIESARGALVRCVERAEGAGLIVGGPGTGKTLLCYLLAEQFRNRFAVAMLFSGHLSSRQDLLRAILFELGLPYRGLDEGELRLSLIDYLTRSEECAGGLLLLIDEAHALPLRLLEEVRMITNVVRGGQPQVRLVLAGGPPLEEHFASPKLESFSQRLAARCYLESFDRSETFNYVRYQMQVVGGDPARTFTDSALEAVYRATDGVPRLINQVCDHALVLAHSSRQRTLDAAMVEAAWADLQQLPAPWNESAAAGDQSTVDLVEFGDLDDEFCAPGPELRLALPPGELIEDEEFFQAKPAASQASVDEIDSVTVTHERLDQLDEQWGLLESDFLGNQQGLPEVELVFDEVPPATSRPDEYEPSTGLSFTGTSSDAVFQESPFGDSLPSEPLGAELSQSDGWEPIEMFAPPAKAPLETAVNDPEPTAQLPIDVPRHQGEPMSQDASSEEVVVDRYATLDALKSRGIFAAPAIAPGAQSPKFAALASPLAAQPVETRRQEPRESLGAEKTLTLAEALVRHATASQQATPPGSMATEVVEVVNAAAELTALAGVWTSLELSAPGPAEPPLDSQKVSLVKSGDEVEQPAWPSESNANREFSRNPSIGRSHMVPFEVAREAHEELDLIVVEEDPQSLVIPTRPEASPVRRQEYRQLFARLRKN